MHRFHVRSTNPIHSYHRRLPLDRRSGEVEPLVKAAADCAFRSSWEGMGECSAFCGPGPSCAHLVRPEPMTRQPRPVRRLLVLLDLWWSDSRDRAVDLFLRYRYSTEVGTAIGKQVDQLGAMKPLRLPE